jgi:preprotein translocase subunit SecB
MLDPHNDFRLCSIRVKFDRKEDNPRRFRIRITIESNNQKSKTLPYEFRITLVGYFKVTEQYPEEQVDLLVSVNGPSVLYSAAREALAALTGRSPLPAIVLPTVTFQSTSLEIQEKEKTNKPRKTTRRKRSARSSKKGK